MVAPQAAQKANHRVGREVQGKAMKSWRRLLIPFSLFFVLAAGLYPGHSLAADQTRYPWRLAPSVAVQQEGTDTPEPGAVEGTAGANQEDPTTTPTPSPTVEFFVRPLVVIQTYNANVSDITPGKEFILEIKLANEGQGEATNVVATFTSGDFLPRETGGVLAVGDLDSGDKHKISQPLSTSYDLWGKNFATLEVNLNYTDIRGVPYHETFTITFPIAWTRIIGPAATATPTITPTPNLRPQMVITAYEIDVEQLQPGNPFTLELNIQNLGNATARRVTMILGGGSTGGTNGTDEKNPPTGGISGGSGDVSNFAPLGSSNVQSLGDLPAGGNITAKQSLIVNVSTNPGAYPLKISFTYIDDNNNNFTDDQIITLLVYSLPVLEINFYRDPGPLMAGQPNSLPLQVVNLGRKSAILGNLTVTAEGADFSNNTILVGSLEPGGYFPMDAMVTPYLSGQLELSIIVIYTNDFNQTIEIKRTLPVEVLEAPLLDSGTDGFPIEPGGPGSEPTQTMTETFWQRVWRLVRGLLGLDSALTTQAEPGEMPPPGFEEQPSEGPLEGQPLKGP